MNTSNVTVTAKDGKVVIASENKPEFGYVRVEQITTVMENGWMNEQKRSALIRGKVESLSKIFKAEGQVLSGKIIVKESTTAFRPDQEPKRAGKDGEILTHNGMPIYREAFYTDDANASDVLLAHDKATVNAGSSVQA